MYLGKKFYMIYIVPLKLPHRSHNWSLFPVIVDIKSDQLAPIKFFYIKVYFSKFYNFAKFCKIVQFCKILQFYKKYIFVINKL